MAHSEQNGMSRSLAIYGLLLGLYPGPFLQRHRAEMLQNFRDLECASPSKTALWLLVGRDLLVSLQVQFAGTLWGQAGMVVLVLAMVLTYAEHHAVVRRHPIEACCLGYILGWFAGWFARQWQAASISHAPRWIRSLPGQAMIVAGALGLVIAVAGTGHRTQNEVLVWTFCYGFLLAWFSGWLGNRRHARS